MADPATSPATPAAPNAAASNDKAPFKKRNEVPTAEELLASINRALPFSDEAEKGVLSCLLQDPNERLSDCRVNLPAHAFYHDANRTIYEKLLEFYDKNLPIDPVTVTHALRDQNLLDKVGGAAAIDFGQTMVKRFDQRITTLGIVEQIILQIGIAAYDPNIAQDFIEHACRAAGLTRAA